MKVLVEQEESPKTFSAIKANSNQVSILNSLVGSGNEKKRLKK